MMDKIDIKDASIAEEIRKNMAIATPSINGLMSNNGFIIRSSAIKTSNYNDLTLSGIHHINDNLMEAENNPGINYGILCVFSTGPYIFQIAASVTNNVVKYRTRTESANGWKSWANI